MICKIVKDNNIYTTHILAIYEERFNSKVLVLDESGTKLNWIYMYDSKYSIEKNVYILDEKDDFIVKKLKVGKLFKKTIYVSGYDFILDYIIDIKNDINDIDLLAKVKKLNDGIILNEWEYINTSKDISKFLTITNDLYDGNISKITYAGNQLEVDIYGCFDMVLHLVFKGEIGIKFSNFTYITSSNIIIDGNKVYLIDNDVDSIDDIKDDDTYFCGNSLKYKLDIETDF